MEHTGNQMADWYNFIYQNSPEPEPKTAYFCIECNCYFDKDGFELHSQDAVENYMIENKTYSTCMEYELKESKPFDLFDTLGKMFNPKKK